MSRSRPRQRDAAGGFRLRWAQRKLEGRDSPHGRVARRAWELLGPDGAAVASGVDFAVLAADGKLRDVTGFFQAPSGAGGPLQA